MKAIKILLIFICLVLATTIQFGSSAAGINSNPPTSNPANSPDLVFSSIPEGPKYHMVKYYWGCKCEDFTENTCIVADQCFCHWENCECCDPE